MFKTKKILTGTVLCSLSFMYIGLQKGAQGATYPSPTYDISWSAGYDGSSDVEAAFNYARTVENQQLGTSLPMINLPGGWDSLPDDVKVEWLIDIERVDRGIRPLDGLEANVNQVAQDYAEYMLDNDVTGHFADGLGPWKRLEAMPAINACHDFLPIAENLAYFWASHDIIELPIERAVYLWMYDDSGSAWGHRDAILYSRYRDNSGRYGREGFLGVGRASGPHNGWPYSEIIVMNVFDPCLDWGADPLPSLSIDDVSQHEDSGVMHFTVSLSSASDSQVRVDYSTQNGSAHAPGDYTSTSDTLVIPAGQNSGTIAVAIVDDTDLEDTETFTVRLSSPENATISDALGQGTILDNEEPLPSLSIDNVTQDEGASPMVFTVSLSSLSAASVRVFYTTTDQSASAPEDYTGVSDVLIIPAGQRFGTISVPIQDDTWEEGNETFAVELSAPQGATFADAQGIGTIVDDDDQTAPVIRLFGANPLTLELDTPYTESGYQAIDNIDGDLTGQVQVDASAVDSTTPGNYAVTYQVTDSAGNVGTTSRIVNVVAVYTLTLSSTPGGSVTSPGEGFFTYADGEVVFLVAEPQPFYEFSHWSGTESSGENPLSLEMDQSKDMTAVFKPVSTVLYVDDNAFDVQTGSVDQPFGSLNQAIEQACRGCIVVVRPGHYQESLDLQNRHLKLTSVDPNNPQRYRFPVIDANAAGPVLRNVGDAVIEGLVLTGGRSETGAVLHGQETNLTLKNCLIVGNRSTVPLGGTLVFEDSNAVLINCTVADNQAGAGGAGILSFNSNLKIQNAIVWGNTPYDVASDTRLPSVLYSCVGGGWPWKFSIHEDPLFAQPGTWTGKIYTMGDFHLQSQTGRWHPQTSTWVTDTQHSPCIDLGNPAMRTILELQPHGNRINLGCYGGTTEASMSVE